MKLIQPLGARVMVELITPIDALSERAKAAGLYIATFEHNQTKPTTGVVVAVGSDPEVQRLIQVGDTVFFSRYAGTDTFVEGTQYRTLEFHEITNVLKDVPDVVQQSEDSTANG
jgi:co-chaperonin GroES (HSP10)